MSGRKRIHTFDGYGYFEALIPGWLAANPLWETSWPTDLSTREVVGNNCSINVIGLNNMTCPASDVVLSEDFRGRSSDC